MLGAGTPKQLKTLFVRAYEDRLRVEVAQKYVKRFEATKLPEGFDLQRGLNYGPFLRVCKQRKDAHDKCLARQLMFQCIPTGDVLHKRGAIVKPLAPLRQTRRRPTASPSWLSGA